MNYVESIKIAILAKQANTMCVHVYEKKDPRILLQSADRNCIFLELSMIKKLDQFGGKKVSNLPLLCPVGVVGRKKVSQSQSRPL